MSSTQLELWTKLVLSEKKKANQTKTLISRYGTLCFLQLLDDEASSVENWLEKRKMERLERAAKFLEVISALYHHYECLITTVESCGIKKDVSCT